MSDFEARADDAGRALGNATPPSSGPNDVRRRLRARRIRYAALASTVSAVALIAAVIAFNGTDHRVRVQTTDTTRTTARTATTVPKPTTTIEAGTVATTAPPAVTSTTVAVAPPASPPPSSEAVASTFFVAWVANDDATLAANGTTGAVDAAKTGRASGTSGFVLSNCQGTAGSIYCTWVRTAERVVLRVDDTTTPHLVFEFRREALDAQGVADEFLNAWEFSNRDAVRVLTERVRSRAGRRARRP